MGFFGTPMFCTLNSAVWIVGLVAVVFWLAVLVLFILKHFTKPSDKVVKKLIRQANGKPLWAVVTGASDGIGKAYAITLAKKGFNIFLISRTQSKLEAVAQEVEKFNVKSKVLAVDFTSTDDSIYEQIAAEVNALPVAVLVNNVGVNYSFPNHYLEATPQEDDNIVRVNIVGTNKMTRIVLPQMVERKGGAIINLSSMSGRIPTPMLSVYSASKAYIDYFSKCIAQEYKSSGVVVQSVTPGMVVSNMSKIRKTSLLVTSPELIAARSIGRLGEEYELSPFHTHGILNRAFNILPLSVSLKYLHNMNKATQKRALRKR